MDPTYFFSTHAQAKSLLDFPPHVRNRIYTYAIYDYDRGAVFLPRALPRKVTAETDKDVEQRFEEDGEVDNGEGAVCHFAWPENVEGCCSAGRWVSGEEDQKSEDEGDGEAKGEEEGETEGNDAADQEDDSFEFLSDEDDMSVTDNSEPEPLPMTDSILNVTGRGNEDELDIVTGQMRGAGDFNADEGLTIAELENAQYATPRDTEALMEQPSTLEICQEFNLHCHCPCHKDEETTSSSAASESDQDEGRGEQDYVDDENVAASFDKEDSKSAKDGQVISGKKQETDADVKDDNEQTSRNDCSNSSNDRQCECPCHPELDNE